MEVEAFATLHLNCFQDEQQVRHIVRSQGLTLGELGGGRVQVRGSYSQLQSANARLKELLEAQSKPQQQFPRSDEAASSAAANKMTSSLTRNRSQSLPRPTSRRTPQSPTVFTHSLNRKSSNKIVETRHLLRQQTESDSFYVSVDVYQYAMQVRNGEIRRIFQTYDAQITTAKDGEQFSLTLVGREANRAAADLKGFLQHLQDSLRTQDVPKKQMSHEGKTLWKSIQKTQNIYHLVMVCDEKESLHLVGPSTESYELKERLLVASPSPNKKPRLLSFPSFRDKKRSKRVKSRVDDNVLPLPAGSAVGGEPIGEPAEQQQRGAAAPWWRRSQRKKEKPVKNREKAEEKQSCTVS